MIRYLLLFTLVLSFQFQGFPQIINSKIIICNADPPFVYKNLLDEKQHNFL